MSPDTLAFLDVLLARCGSYRDSACLTLTAMHPDGQHPTPSRHIPLHAPLVLQDALNRLDEANRQGWGAFFGVGLRKMGLTRWRRGGEADVIALPALFADVDDPAQDALDRLQDAVPVPSCITATGGGYHAFWTLFSPTPDLARVRQALRALAALLGGDLMSPAQSLRLAGSCNTKPQRENALCQVVVLHDACYSLSDFDPLVERLTSRRRAKSPAAAPVRHASSGSTLNPAVIAAVTQVLVQQGCRRSGDWLSGPCLYPHRHHHEDRHTSFGFNTHTAYGNCYICGSLLLKDICQALDIRPAEYGGLRV